MKIIPKCKKCDKPISLIWLLFSNENKNYRCSSCGSMHQWSKNSNAIFGLIVLSWIVLNGIARYFFVETIPRIIVSLFLLLLIIYIFKLTRFTLAIQAKTNEKT